MEREPRKIKENNEVKGNKEREIHVNLGVINKKWKARKKGEINVSEIN